MGRIRRTLLRAGAGTVGLACALALVPGTALAGGASRADPVVDTIQIGPIPARDGFVVYLTDLGCGSVDPSFQVTFVNGTAADQLTHTYTGVDASCTITGSPAHAELRVALPGTLEIAAQVVASPGGAAHPGLPLGCGGSAGPELPAVASGRIDVAIHAGVFGRVAHSRADADIFSTAHPPCPASGAGGGRELTADLGTDIIDAGQPAHGAPELDIYHSAGDVPAAGLTGALELHLEGGRAYALTSPAGSAQIGSEGPFASGSLAFAALPACPGDTAVNGTLAGTFTIDDPLLGPLVLQGADATLAYTGIGPARAGGCNGPGSQPVEPELINNCSVDGSCSVQAGTNTVTFSDETDPGTQTISSEQVNFGDGSAAPLAGGAVVTHTYSQPGSYVATLSVEDTAGVTSSTTTDVDVDP